jgi:hypothetical protein
VGSRIHRARKHLRQALSSRVVGCGPGDARLEPAVALFGKKWADDRYLLAKRNPNV